MRFKKLIFTRNSILVILLPVYLSTNAQTGPGGVGNASNNALWLVVEGNSYTDAGSTSAADGNSVQQWNDISGNNKHATQTTGTYQPVLKTGQANGFAALRFDGSDDRILSEDISTSDMAAIFVVAKHINIARGSGVTIGIIQGGPDGLGFSNTEVDKSVGIWTNGTLRRLHGRGVEEDGTLRNLSFGTQLSTDIFYIIAQQYDGTNIKQYVDASPSSSVSYDGTLRSWQDFGIGQQGSQSLDGDITEVIAYTTSLNTAQQLIVQNYLAAKYDRILSVDDLYNEDDPANGNYDFEVAGIGRADANNEHTEAQGTGMVRVLGATNLEDNEYFIWGHDNQPAVANETDDLPPGVSARFQRVWRVSEIGETGSVKIRFDLSDLGSVVGPGNLRLLVDDDNDGLFATSTVLSGATALGNDVYEFDDVSAINNNMRFTLGVVMSSAPVLAFSITRFEAIVTSTKQVELVWSTASQQSDTYFTIERSKNGTQWNAIQRIDVRGNSTVPSDYRLIDNNPYPGKSFYRLKQNDPDGQIHYSKMEQVFIAGAGANYFLYPNPATDQIILSGNNLVLSEIKMYDLAGRNINSLVRVLTTGSNSIVLDVSRLRPGIYIFKIGAGAYKLLKK